MSARSVEVHYYVHGRGRGHASRARDVTRALTERGVGFELFGGGDAADLLGRHPRWHGRAPLQPGVFAVPRLLGRTLHDARALGRRRPDAVISDGDQPALCAARLLGVPSLAIGHDLALTLCDLPRAIRWDRRWHQRLNALPMRLAERWVAVHFLPLSAARPNLIVARPDCTEAALDPDAAPALPPDFVLCYFRDGDGEPVVRQLRAAGQRVVWFGPEASAAEGVSAFALNTPAFRHALVRCSAVVASAGSNLLAECVTFGKPMFALYRARDSEQAINAQLAEAAGVAASATLERLNQPQLTHFLGRVRSGDFARHDLKAALPPVSVAVAGALLELLHAGNA